MENIAKANEYTGIDTLLTCGSDSFDWAEMSIETLRHLMEAAFQAGLDAAHHEGITQVVESEGEEYTEADEQVVHPAPQTIEDEDDAKRVGTHRSLNTWMPIGAGKQVLVYTTWANANGWRKVPALYTTTPGGTYQLAAWNEAGFDNNRMREEANAEALTWAITNA